MQSVLLPSACPAKSRLNWSQSPKWSEPRLRLLENIGLGGSVWESNLLFTDTSSTYEGTLGLSWKDLASFGTLIAALLLPRFLIPLLSQAGPFQRLCCLLFASRQASPACRYSLSCGCRRDGEAPAVPSNPLAGRAAGSSKNGETCASQSGPVRHEFPQEVSEFAGSSTAILAFPLRKGLEKANRCPLRLARFPSCIREGELLARDALANSCLSWSS